MPPPPPPVSEEKRSRVSEAHLLETSRLTGGSQPRLLLWVCLHPLLQNTPSVRTTSRTNELSSHWFIQSATASASGLTARRCAGVASVPGLRHVLRLRKQRLGHVVSPARGCAFSAVAVGRACVDAFQGGWWKWHPPATNVTFGAERASGEPDMSPRFYLFRVSGTQLIPAHDTRVQFPFGRDHTD